MRTLDLDVGKWPGAILLACVLDPDDSGFLSMIILIFLVRRLCAGQGRCLLDLRVEIGSPRGDRAERRQNVNAWDDSNSVDRLPNCLIVSRLRIYIGTVRATQVERLSMGSMGATAGKAIAGGWSAT